MNDPTNNPEVYDRWIIDQNETRAQHSRRALRRHRIRAGIITIATVGGFIAALHAMRNGTIAP